MVRPAQKRFRWKGIPPQRLARVRGSTTALNGWVYKQIKKHFGNVIAGELCSRYKLWASQLWVGRTHRAWPPHKREG